MEEVVKLFSLNDIEMFRDDDDVDFAIVKLYALADGNNSHKNPISEETLKKYGNTILGKFIIGKYSSLEGDVTTHVPSQSILGYVPQDQEVEYELKDGKTFITVLGRLSKLYATDVVTMFKKDNFRNVSCEFSCLEGEEDFEGNKEILSFDIHAITILGLRYQPSCAGAEIKVMKFSKEESDPLKKFADSRRKDMADTNRYKINKTELKETPWGDVDKTTMRDKIMDASNRDSLVNSVYLLVEDGWEDAPSEHLKYPVMELSGDTFYYNRYGLSSALTYANAEDEDEVVAKLKKLYKKFKLEFPEDSKGKGKEMSQEKDKEFEIEGREAWGDVIKKVEDHEGKGVYVQSVEKDHIIFKKDDVVYRVEADVKAGKDDKNVSASIKWDTVKKDKVQKDFEDKEEDKKEKKYEDKPDPYDDDDEVKREEKKERKDKKLSLDGNADAGALLEMLAKETKENVGLSKMVTEMQTLDDDNVIMQKFVEHFCKMAKEKDELEEKVIKAEAKETEAIFAQTMAKVKGVMEEKEYEKLYSEGKEIKSKEKMENFSLKVKGFAFDAIPPDTNFRYASNGGTIQRKDFSAMDVWEKIENNQ